MRSEDSDELGPDTVRYTAAEILAALDGMSDDDHRRLTMVARYFAPRTDMSEDDLRQEAFLRVLSSRTCRVGVGIVEFLAGTIKSIASETPKARKRARENAGLELVYVPEYGSGDVPEPADLKMSSPEDQALARTMYAKEIERAGRLVSGDYELELLVEALADGHRGKDLEEVLGTDTKGLAAARKRWIRKLQVSFPDGVPL
jgi:DNA-directed RNA polymerase specialized sigma24 family protein